jgi:hypothetical protein
MKMRSQSERVVGLSILIILLLAAVSILIGIRLGTSIRSTTTLPSSSESSSSQSQADVVAKANSQLPEPRDQEQLPAAAIQTHSDFSATRSCVAEFSGFTTSDRPIVSSTPSPTPKEEEAPLPLALKSVDPTALQITREQQQIINELRQSFIERLAAAELNPDDPRYAALWEQLQPEIDQQLRAQLGQEFFLQYERAAKVEK